MRASLKYILSFGKVVCFSDTDLKTVQRICQMTHPFISSHENFMSIDRKEIERFFRENPTKAGDGDDWMDEDEFNRFVGNPGEVAEPRKPIQNKKGKKKKKKR